VNGPVSPGGIVDLVVPPAAQPCYFSGCR